MSHNAVLALDIDIVDSNQDVVLVDNILSGTNFDFFPDDLEDDPGLHRDHYILFLTLQAMSKVQDFRLQDSWAEHIGRTVYDSFNCYNDADNCLIDQKLILNICQDIDCLNSTLDNIYFVKSVSSITQHDYIFSYEYASSLLNKMLVSNRHVMFYAIVDWFRLYNLFSKFENKDFYDSPYIKSLAQKLFNKDYGSAVKNLIKPWPDFFVQSSLWNYHNQYVTRDIVTSVIDMNKINDMNFNFFAEDHDLQNKDLNQMPLTQQPEDYLLLLQYGLMTEAHPSQVIRAYFSEGYGKRIICFTDHENNFTNDCQGKLTSYLRLMANRYNVKMTDVVPDDDVIDFVKYYHKYFAADTKDNKNAYNLKIKATNLIPFDQTWKERTTSDQSNAEIMKFWHLLGQELLQPMLPEEALELDLIQYVNKTKQIVHSVNDMLSEYVDFYNYVNRYMKKSTKYRLSSQDLQSQILNLYDAILHGKVAVSPFLALSFLNIQPENAKHCDTQGSENCRIRFFLDPNLRIWSNIMHANNANVSDGYNNIKFRTNQAWFQYLMRELLRRRAVILDKLKYYQCQHRVGMCRLNSDRDKLLLTSSEKILEDYKPQYFTDDILTLQHLDRKIVGGFKDLLNSKKVNYQESIKEINLVTTALQTACMLDDYHYSKIQHYNSQNNEDLDMFWHVHNCVARFLVPDHQDYELFSYYKVDLSPIIKNLILQKRIWVNIAVAIDLWQYYYGEIDCRNFNDCVNLSDTMLNSMRILGNKYELIFHLMHLDIDKYSHADLQSLLKLNLEYQQYTRFSLPQIEKNKELLQEFSKKKLNKKTKTQDMLNDQNADKQSQQTKSLNAIIPKYKLSQDTYITNNNYLILTSREAKHLQSFFSKIKTNDIHHGTQQTQENVLQILHLHKFNYTFSRLNYYLWYNLFSLDSNLDKTINTNNKSDQQKIKNHNNNIFVECQVDLLHQIKVIAYNYDNNIDFKPLTQNKSNNFATECFMNFVNTKYQKSNNWLYSLQVYIKNSHNIFDVKNFTNHTYRVLQAQQQEQNIDLISYSRINHNVFAASLNNGVWKALNQNLDFGIINKISFINYVIYENNVTLLDRQVLSKDKSLSDLQLDSVMSNINDTAFKRQDSMFLFNVNLQTFMRFRKLITDDLSIHSLALNSVVDVGCNSSFMDLGINNTMVICFNALHLQAKYTYNVDEHSTWSYFIGFDNHIFTTVHHTKLVQPASLHYGIFNSMALGIEFVKSGIGVTGGINLEHVLSEDPKMAFFLKLEIVI